MPSLDAMDRGLCRVPLSFDEYMRATGAREVPTAVCDSCGAPGARWMLTAGPVATRDQGDETVRPQGPVCARCAGYRYGYDQAEEKLVRSIIGAAIAAALDAGASPELVRSAADEALSEIWS